jgi:hypothetical protein
MFTDLSLKCQLYLFRWTVSFDVEDLIVCFIANHSVRKIFESWFSVEACKFYKRFYFFDYQILTLERFKKKNDGNSISKEISAELLSSSL